MAMLRTLEGDRKTYYRNTKVTFSGLGCGDVNGCGLVNVDDTMLGCCGLSLVTKAVKATGSGIVSVSKGAGHIAAEAGRATGHAAAETARFTQHEVLRPVAHVAAEGGRAVGHVVAEASRWMYDKVKRITKKVAKSVILSGGMLGSAGQPIMSKDAAKALLIPAATTAVTAATSNPVAIGLVPPVSNVVIDEIYAEIAKKKAEGKSDAQIKQELAAESDFDWTSPWFLGSVAAGIGLFVYFRNRGD